MQHIAMGRLFCQICYIVLCLPQVSSKAEFYGATMSVTMKNMTQGNMSAHVSVMSGWKLGSGPCGSTCNQTYVGHSTRNQRFTIENTQNDKIYFGKFSVEYKEGGRVTTSDLTEAVKVNFTERVVAVSKLEGWELDYMEFTVILDPPGSDEDISFSGHYWCDHIVFGSNKEWRMQLKVSNNIRNDTAFPNRPPRAIVKPLYRILFGETTTIAIPVVDDEGDFIICKAAKAVESNYMVLSELESQFSIMGIIINESLCTVTFEALPENGFRIGMMIPVTLSIKDFSRNTIQFGSDIYTNSYMLTMSTIPVQLIVKVESVLETPTFVYPTYGPNHKFIIYAGASWEVVIYVKSTSRPLHALRVIADRKNRSLSTPELDHSRADVYFVQIRDTFENVDKKHSIACFTAIDKNSVESAEFLCFLVEYKEIHFTFAQSTMPDQRLYFIDVPSPTEHLTCPINATCVIPLFVNSTTNIRSIDIINSRVNYSDVSTVKQDSINRPNIYKADIYIRHLIAESIKLCVIATDINRLSSEPMCFNLNFTPPDPCFDQPCLNGGVCQSDAISGKFECKCIDNFNGDSCEKERTPCDNKPCGDHGICYPSPSPYYCFCSDDGYNPNDYSGINCTDKVDDCQSNPCQNDGVCVDGVLIYTCDCLTRFTGENCETDLCEHSQSRTSCPNDTCSEASCNGNGKCVNNVCNCTIGYEGPHCIAPIGDISKRTELSFVSPSIRTGSSITCFVCDGYLCNCDVMVYISCPESTDPVFKLESSTELKLNSSITAAVAERRFKGIDNMRRATLSVRGKVSSNEDYFICVEVQSIEAMQIDNICYRIIVHQYETTLQHIQQNFLSPTLHNFSYFICEVDEKCRLMFINDQTSSFCHTDIQTTSKIDLVIFDAFKDTESGDCITEIALKYTFPMDDNICFKNGQNRGGICFAVSSFSRNTDPCSGSINGSCQNDGRCFPINQTAYVCVCQQGFAGNNCEIVITNMNCNFDNNSFCGWKNAHTGDNFDRILYHGPTPSAGTGPSVDHTIGNLNGTYAFIETSAPRQSNESARLQSPLITPHGKRYCLSFWYNMFGPTIGQLNVYISGNTVTPPSKVLWSQSRDQGSSWLNSNIEINATDPFKLTFEGKVGDGYEGDIALDDIALSVGHCVSLTTVSYQTTNFTRMSVPNTTPTTTPHGMHGTGCYGNPCIRGVCYVHLDEYFCLCPSGFEGRNCQIDADECRSQPCKNGGTCEDDVDNFMCHCVHGYTGKLCETEIDECLSQPCQHGGRCVDGLNHYTCMCLDGFDGEHCQNVLDPCYDSPCMRGTCFSHSSLFLCVCPPGYSGKFCEKVQI